ncbi:MAG: hypothetical protein IJ634_05855 [Bacteroidales bacterium]|nr:hypothetical protein [Bacteroidales bacterium]
MPSSGYNRLVRAVRYGRYFMLKGLKAEYAGDEVYRTLLRKEFEIMVQMDHPNITVSIRWRRFRIWGCAS